MTDGFYNPSVFQYFMAKILSIETSTKACSVAIHGQGKLITSQKLFVEKSHSSHLTKMIEAAIKNADMIMGDLDAVAISMGPGSYTGLRIGTATAKGICYALDIPLIAVNTLKAMAFGVNKYNNQKSLLCPMIDARRMEVFCLVTDSDLKVFEETNAKVIDENSFDGFLDNNSMLFFGDGAEKCKSTFEGNSNAVFIDDVTPSAIDIGYLATAKYDKKSFEDVAYFEPFYLKDFVAIKSKKTALI